MEFTIYGNIITEFCPGATVDNQEYDKYRWKEGGDSCVVWENHSLKL